MSSATTPPRRPPRYDHHRTWTGARDGRQFGDRARITQDLAGEGRHVVRCGRSAPRLQATAEACQRAGGSAEVVPAYLAIWADAEQADWRAAVAAVDVGLRAAVALTHATAGAMPSGGAMVYLASRAARTAFGHNASYVAAKHCLAGLAGSVFEDVRAARGCVTEIHLRPQRTTRFGG